MGCLSVSFPNLEIAFPKEDKCNEWQLAIAGGRVPSVSLVKKLAVEKHVFCADKGIDIALKAGVLTKLLLGDGDSAVAEEYQKAMEQGTKVIRYPREKDATDLQLLLENLENKHLCITGVWGGRFDHLYSNCYSLLKWSRETGKKIVMVDDKEIMVFLKSEDDVAIRLVDDIRPKAISLLNFSNDAVVDLQGVYWSLDKAHLNYLQPYAISNEAVENKLFCHCYSGEIGLYICWKE